MAKEIRNADGIDYLVQQPLARPIGCGGLGV